MGKEYFITIEDIIDLHSYISPEGLLNRESLESAYYAPFQIFDEEAFFPTILEKIVRLSYGIIVNHAFVDGNKRLGLALLQSLTSANGIILEASDIELRNIILDIAKGDVTYDDFIVWVRNHIREDKFNEK